MLTLAAGSVLDLDPLAIAELAAVAGFDAIGLRLSADHALDAAGAAELRRRCDALGLAVHDVEVHRIGDSATADVGQVCDAAAAVGAHALLVVSDTDERATRTALGAVVARAAASGLVVGLEYMAWTTPSLPADAVTMADETGAVVVVDLLHHVRVGAGVAELAAVVASGRLGWVQLADAPSARPADLVHEARHARLPPGEGGLPLHELLAVVPPDAVMSVEVQSDALAAERTPADRVAHLAAAARSLVSR
jgi:sugar phosphate isomerase/epimerase